MPAPILINNYSTQQLFLGEKFFKYVTYVNPSGSTATLTAGMVMGQILASGNWLPNISSATDGSEMPRAILAESYTVAGSATQVIAICIKGEVNKNMVTLGSGDTWATAVRTVSTGGGTIESLLTANSEIILVPSIDTSNYDNN